MGKKQGRTCIDETKLTSHPVPRMINTLTYKRASTTTVAKQTTKRVEPRISAAPFSFGFDGRWAGSMIAGVNKFAREIPELGNNGATRQGIRDT